MPPETDNHIVAASMRELTAALRAEAEQLLDQIQCREAAAARLAADDDASLRTGLASATALYSLNCVIKLGWASKACAAIDATEDCSDTASTTSKCWPP